jgi:GTP cyclohydrolase I
MTKIKANSNLVLDYKEEKKMIKKLEKHFTKILQDMNFDLENDQQIKDTPHRVAKMWVKELFSGCYNAEPKITVFDNTEKCKDIVFVGPISIKSTCSHHFVPFIGQAYIAYIPNEKIIGVSKLARITKWFMRRPQIQEELTKQIADYIMEKLEPQGVAVFVEAQHLCMTVRGVEESNSFMKTSAVRGIFNEDTSAKHEFFDMIKNNG